MQIWRDGYVADIPYIAGFYPNHAPAHLDLVCLLGGVEPAADRDRFTWCELGCGQGLTANLLAASHPDAVFHGVDFHGEHIAAARAMAEVAGLFNVTFHQRDFGACADDPDLPMFDYVVAHGVYSWVGPEAKADIVRFLDRRLKPGGVALVSYNNVPGWARLAPLQALLMAHSRASTGGSIARLRHGLDIARRMQAAGAEALADVPLPDPAAPLAGRSVEEGEAYLAHEYLNAHWRPLLHADVAADLATAGLAFAGSARIFQNVKDLVLSRDAQALLDDVDDPALRESLADYFGQPPLRSDVFVRAPRRLSREEAETRLGDVRLALAGQVPLPLTIEGKAASIVLEPRHYAPMLAALRNQVCTIRELLDLLGCDDAPSAREVAVTLVGSEQVLPARFAPAPRANHVARFNLHQLEQNSDKVTALATGVGAGILLNPHDAAVCRVLLSDPALDEPAIVARVQEAMHGAPLQAGRLSADLRADAARRFETAQATCATLRTMPAMLDRLGLRSHQEVPMFVPDLPMFETDLFIPRYRPMQRGDWTLRIAQFVIAPGYWSPPRMVAGMAALVRSGSTWMSITPMELESQEIGIRAARGHVAIFGMGLGWAAAATAMNPDVTRVTVVEQDRDVLDMHDALDIFAQLPDAARAKIGVEQGDAYAWTPDAPVDLLMPDIWLPLMNDGRVDEVRRMQDNVQADAIYFWGQEMEIARHAVAAGRALDADGIAATVADWRLPLFGPEIDGYAGTVEAVARQHMHGRWLPGSIAPF